ncbi:hypothetical protein M501DRAFT_995968 [Patellaria atrata CBS 101060]|uniref:AAA+ ATPase domain-containing protein n=1 Tax=Patellaria atrata CBS 101060 TaxID=1346257 RepID=A0A9P4VRB0_9PEZI|nr:hypothetical protein M501DRAFT_995968 [Patellaria atrata CBS 101060]
MDCTFSSDIFSSFDPAIHLHSENFDIPNLVLDPSYNDELEAIEHQIEESKAQKNKEGIVIQHRIWNNFEVFRSEEDNSIDSPLQRLSHEDLSSLPCFPSSDPIILPSSPPELTMPLLSSPVMYSATSSPAPESPRKKRKIESLRSPLKDMDANNGPRPRTVFLMEESDDEDDIAALKAAQLKRNIATEIDALQRSSQKTILTADDMVSNAYNVQEEPSHLEDEPTIIDTEEDASAFSQPPQLSKSFNAPLIIRTCTGKSIYVAEKRTRQNMTYEQLIAARSKTEASGARKSYYGIDIHKLMDEAAKETEEALRISCEMHAQIVPSIEQPAKVSSEMKPNRTLMWTEKYRARKFTDLIGDERTHRSVLRWLKGWDQVIFPGSERSRPKSRKSDGLPQEERVHRKILMLTGPPGLGKTTLAHVCAKQAGYEVQEINASDERSSAIVKGRIKDMLGTENVRGVNIKNADGKVRKAGRPVCVVVDEVDGVVSGSGGSGEGGFIKALIDLINLDQKNSQGLSAQDSTTGSKRKKKGDRFRLLRPLILICNDVYHPSLRPLRQSSIAEIIHIRKPPLSMVISRMHSIFEKEGMPCDVDGVRRLCEATWGVSNRKDGGTGSGTGEGDIRGIMVVSEWVAGCVRAAMSSGLPGSIRLTRKWLEENILNDLAHGGGAARSLGRGGVKEVVERVFVEGAGFPKIATAQSELDNVADASGIKGVAEATKRRGMERLREMIETSGDSDKIMTECFTTYPTQPFQDDTLVSKPCHASSWLHFYDTLSAQVFSQQEWELAPYLSQPILAFHHLFASTSQRPSFALCKAANDESNEGSESLPFTGPGAAFAAAEATKANRSALLALQSSLSIPLARLYRSTNDLATELLPYLLRMLAPDVKPVIISSGSSTTDSNSKFRTSTASVRKSSEKLLVARAVNAMAATGVRFERSRVEKEAGKFHTGNAWIYRMEPPLDSLGEFATAGKQQSLGIGTRFAVRQVLSAEWERENVRREAEARRRRGGVDSSHTDDENDAQKGKVETKEDEKREKGVKRDFFGRKIPERPESAGTEDMGARKKRKSGEGTGRDEGRVWVSFNEGYSNAVRKPITIAELMRGL